MMRELNRRLRRLEAARASRDAARIGNVIRYRDGETRAQAVQRLYPGVAIPRGHGFLIVPERVRDATRAEWERRFHHHQTELIASLHRDSLRRAKETEQ